jgi:hypothetical protein
MKRIFLTESRLRQMVALLLEGALNDDAARISAKEGDRRKDQWEETVESLHGVPAAKQILSWLSANVPLNEPLADVVPLVIDWARMRDEKRLLRGEEDLTKLDRTSLERINKRANIGRDIALKMPERIASVGAWDIYLPMNIGESCAVARMASEGNSSYEIPWCTARDKNNMFYGYAANDVLLYYVVNRTKPEIKYSLGFGNGNFIPPANGGATVDWRNLAFDPEEAFKGAWDAIMDTIQSHIQKVSAGGQHPAAVRVVEAASDPTAWRELVKRTSNDPEHVLGLYKVLVMPSKKTALQLKERMRNGIVPMHPQVAMSFLLTAARAGETDYSLLNYYSNAFVKVLHNYWDYLQETSDGKQTEADIAKISNDSIGAPGGYHTPASFIMKWINERKSFESGKSKVIESLGAVGHWSSLEGWIIQNAKMITTGGRGPKVDFAAHVAERMTDSQLAIMIDPFEVFEMLDTRLPDYLTQSWDHETWAGFLLARLMKLNNSMAKRSQYFFKLLEPYGRYYQLPLKHMYRAATRLPKKQQEMWENLELLTLKNWEGQ